MITPLTIAVEAEVEADAEEAAMWHERKKQNWGVEDGLTIRRVVELPEQYGRVYGQLRRAPVHRFRYGVFFRFLNHQVRVVAILHNRRNPKAWMKRR